MDGITTAVTNILGVVTTVVSTITGEPVLALGLGVSVLCSGIVVFKKLRG